MYSLALTKVYLHMQQAVSWDIIHTLPMKSLRALFQVPSPSPKKLLICHARFCYAEVHMELSCILV